MQLEARGKGGEKREAGTGWWGGGEAVRKRFIVGPLRVIKAAERRCQDQGSVRGGGGNHLFYPWRRATHRCGTKTEEESAQRAMHGRTRGWTRGPRGPGALLSAPRGSRDPRRRNRAGAVFPGWPLCPEAPSALGARSLHARRALGTRKCCLSRGLTGRGAGS